MQVLQGAVIMPWRGLILCLLLLFAGRIWSVPIDLTLWATMVASDGLLLMRLWAFWLALSLMMRRCSPRMQWWVHGVLGTLTWSAMAGLDVYFQQAGVPLGADAFAYHWDEIRATVSGAEVRLNWPVGLSWAAACVCWWGALNPSRNQVHIRSAALWVGLVLAIASSVLLPIRLAQSNVDREWQANNKLLLWVEDVWAHLKPSDLPTESVTDYPFEHTEATPDTLGPLFNLDAQSPPHIVLVVVEGLGRSFSGPGARLGSFTPALDAWIERSLYWDHFLANQGRTFAVLPSVLSSLPFGEHGEQPKPHHSLPGWLRKNGYALRYFTGTHLSFDHQGSFLQSLGFDHLFSDADFVGRQKASEWGYDDGDLLAQVTAAPWPKNPSLTVIQTMSMHSPFKVRDMGLYRTRAQQRMQELGLTGAALDEARQHLDVYASILHTDEALGRFLSQLALSPQGRNVLVVITGDHRLPEIPMQTHLERYHVPLLIYAPMLQKPQRFKSVSSHFDVAPSMLAMLSGKYGWEVPERVHWMGSGLDVHPEFRNLHVIPLKQTKTELVDWVSGEYVLHRDRLMSLQDGMTAEPEHNETLRVFLQKSLSTFKSKLQRAETEPAWVKNIASVRWVGFSEITRSMTQSPGVARFAGLSVTGLTVQQHSVDELIATAQIRHVGDAPAPIFVPLLVVTDASGAQKAEFSGPAMRLVSGQSQEVTLKMPMPPLSNQTHFVSLVVSHPDTGQSIGRGQYHVALRR